MTLHADNFDDSDGDDHVDDEVDDADDDDDDRKVELWSPPSQQGVQSIIEITSALPLAQTSH